MATIKELVQTETESFAKAQKLRKAAEKMAENMRMRSEIAKEVRTSP